MRLLEHPLYQKEVESVGELPLPWERFQDSTMAISGATGMLGHFLIDVLMYRNRTHQQNCTVYALGRTEEKAKTCFSEYWEDYHFCFLTWQMGRQPDLPKNLKLDYLFHMASTTHPLAYATEPIDTIMVNVVGLHQLLETAVHHGTKRFLFVSSGEIYGIPASDNPVFQESVCGSVDCNTLRACYPEGKRAGEALCQAFRQEKNLDFVSVRPCRAFGPTMLFSDSKAASQFIKNGIAHENIVLKSPGTQLFSYSHGADVISGILYALLLGGSGEAYNIASGSIQLKDLAQAAADCAGTRVIFQLPEAVEKSGYSVVKRSVLDTAKLEKLGWKSLYSISQGIQETVEILTDVWKGNEPYETLL